MWKEKIFSHEGLEVLFYHNTDVKQVKMLGIFPERYSREIKKSGFNRDILWPCSETEMHCTGEPRRTNGEKMTDGVPGTKLELKDIVEKDEPPGKKVVLVYEYPPLGMSVESHYLFIRGVPVVRRWVTVTNNGEKDAGLEYMFSAVVHGIGLGGKSCWDRRLLLNLPYSSWCREAQWSRKPLVEHGIQKTASEWAGHNCISISQTNSMSSNSYLPMAVLEDTEKDICWFWQIEHNGSWHWELGEMKPEFLYLLAGGPNEKKNLCWKNLKPGMSFTTVPVALGCAEGGFQEAVNHLTRYRRSACLAKHEDNRKLNVIFNDFMNCFSGDPTTEKEMPYVEAAAEAGVEFFVIDAGWFGSPEAGWSINEGLGEWEENEKRFPGGLNRLFDRVREKGMVPGLWLEVEVASTKSSIAGKPDSWFMCRHGRRININERYFFDFRNPEVTDYITGVVDRLVRDYGIGYIKNDYNASAEMGFDSNADSPGEGLLGHNRAFLAWIESIQKKHPGLILENCGGGGLRMDYAMLSRCQLQSSSDQKLYYINPSIVTGEMAAVLPEQLAGWCYPMKKGDDEETIFNMVNVMLGRIHLSGQLAQLPGRRQEIVKNAISIYKSYREEIPRMLPYYPTGTLLATDTDKWHSFGLIHENKRFMLLSVWRLKTDKSSFSVPLPFLRKKKPVIEQLFPEEKPAHFRFDGEKAVLSVKFSRPLTARLFRIDYY